MELSKARILFMGSPDFAIPALNLLSENAQVVCVVTQPDRPSGRGRTLRPSPVKVTALEYNLHLVQPEKLNDPQVIKLLKGFEPDLIVVAAYGQILRRDVLEMAPYGCVNIHASLLPRWRGAAPIQACILAGDNQTGITIMKMDAGVDTGPILNQRSIPIDALDTGGTLFKKLALLSGGLLMETLPSYLADLLTPQNQDDEHATYAPMLKKEDGLLDTNQSAEILTRKVRAYDPWPGTFILFKNNQLKVKVAHAQPGKEIAGRRLVIDGNPAISTDNGLLILDIVQPSGKKPMAGKAFLSGAWDWQNT